ncbi:transcription factor Adf-1-like [Episyrphus balteatus]|uniref:transcription factor Adf-1-like n=1 Tax=Episyrphus balteatus TaxID=286459 RepID=UPI002485761F|nr:transcription factor Adf-1-like [Episyrphus balteatus]
MAAENMEKREFDEKLILEVEANPALYNKSERSYSDRYKKEEGWQNIAIVLNADVKLCRERWKNLRDTFAKCYKKEKYTPSGSQAPIKISWPYYEIMKFLIPNVEVPRTFGNMEKEGDTNNEVFATVPTEEEITTPSNKRPNSSPTAQKPTKKK